MKLFVAALILAVLGVPLLETWKALLLAVCGFALAFSRARAGWRRIALAVAVVLMTVATKAMLPAADIPEAHNAFLITADGEALERGLPPTVFRSWKAQFDALYPAASSPDRAPWRAAGPPQELFTASADAIWRQSKYTRQVDAIDFSNLGEFRGGFANEVQYNFWAGELRREAMPFYVMYELTPSSVGSRLAWTGQAFWERGDGGFDEVVHVQPAAQEIGPADAGKRVYAAFFPKRDPAWYFALLPSLPLRAAAWANVILTAAGALGIIAITLRLRWRPWLRAVSIFAAAYALMMAFVAVSAGKYLGSTYPPHGGGDDGLVHDGWGRLMAMLAGQGQVAAALEGTEPVYWFTPGTRYVRMVEKLVFGDTNHLFALLVACLPVVVFYLARHFVGRRWAWMTTALFCLAPVGNPSLLQHIANAKLGYGEAVGGGLFLVGLVLLLRSQPAWRGVAASPFMIGAGGAALAGSMFIRPNFAIAVACLAGAHAWASWRRGDGRAVAALAAGLALALWMPFHNWHYGGEFHLISGARSVAVPLGPGDYVTGFLDAVRGVSTDTTVRISRQLTGWLLNPGLLVRPQLEPLAWAATAVRLIGLALACVTIALAIARRPVRRDLAVLAATAVCAHIPMLFIFATHYRYAMLGWDLSFVVLLTWVTRCHRPTRQPVSRPAVPAH